MPKKNKTWIICWGSLQLKQLWKVLTSSLGFLTGVSMGTSCGISSSSSDAALFFFTFFTFLLPSAVASACSLSSVLFFFVDADSWNAHKLVTFPNVSTNAAYTKKNNNTFWVLTCTHLVFRRLSLFRLQDREMAQVWGVDRQSHRRLTLNVDEFNHWSFL